MAPSDGYVPFPPEIEARLQAVLDDMQRSVQLPDGVRLAIEVTPLMGYERNEVIYRLIASPVTP